MYATWGGLVLHQFGDRSVILSQVFTLRFTSTVCPATTAILDFHSFQRPASFAGQIFNFPTP